LNKKQQKKDKVIESLSEMKKSIDHFKKKEAEALIAIDQLKADLILLKKRSVPAQGLRNQLNILQCRIREYDMSAKMEFIHYRAYHALKMMHDGTVSMEILKQYTKDFGKIKYDDSVSQIDSFSEKMYDMETIVSEMGDALDSASSEIQVSTSQTLYSTDDLDELFDEIVLGKSTGHEVDNLLFPIRQEAPPSKTKVRKIENEDSDIHKTKQNVAVEAQT